MFFPWMPARIIGGLMLALVLGGCSAIKLGYNALPDLAYWWLDGYVDFSDEQIPRVREGLTRLHAWHRQQELPRIAELLARAEQMAPGPVSPAQACSFVADAQARMNALADEAEGTVVAVAVTLTPRQLRHMERKFATKNADFRADFMDRPVAERNDKRLASWLERMEMVYGRLDGPQRTALRNAIEQSAWDGGRILAERVRRQQDLMQTLRQLHERGIDTAKARTVMRGWLQRMQVPPDAQARQYQDTLLQESCRMFSAVHESSNAEQRAQAVRRLRAYQRDLKELASG